MIYGDYTAETIEFEAYDHFGYPEFAELDTVLLYVSADEEGFFHHKYLFQPVYRTADGGWAECGDPYGDDDNPYRGDLRARSVEFEPEVRFDTSALSAAELSERCPERYFEHRPNAAICRKGAPAELLFEVMRSGVLTARGVFGDALGPRW